MATISELVYDVREALKLYADDVEIDNRYIEYLYGVKRAKYLRQDMNNLQRTIDLSALQTFCMEVEEVSANECSVAFDCEKVLRTKKKLPVPIDLHTRPAIISVKPSNVLSRPFNFITKERVGYVTGSPFNGIYAFLDSSDYIYVYSKSDIRMLQCLTVTGVFEDPFELMTYSNCCGCSVADNPCFDPKTSDYPLQPHLIDLIRGEIINELARREQVKEDTQNNAEES